MLDVLTRLTEEGEFDQSLRLAEQLMHRTGWSPAEMAMIHLAICRARLGMHDLHGAITAGVIAATLAEETGKSDLLGRTCLNLGTAYVGIRQYHQALQQFNTYLNLLPKLTEARRLEGAILKHVGIAYQRMLEPQKAIEALSHAREWFRQRRIDYGAFTCTHDLINTHLQMNEIDPFSDLEPVRKLLADMKRIARRHPEQTYYQGTYLLDQSAYYQHEGRTGHAIRLAELALAAHPGDRMHAFHCHLIRYRCAMDTGDIRTALGHALAARRQAVEGRLHELEQLASQAMAEVVQQEQPGLVRRLDQEYLASGVDLADYLSPAILRRPVN